MTTGARIREARKQRDLTQEKLAHAAEVSLITVSRWERDKNKPWPRQLPAIAKALGVDVEWLTQDEEADAAAAAMASHVENFAAALLAAFGMAVIAKKTPEPERAEPTEPVADRFSIPRFGQPGRPSYDADREAPR